MNKKGFTLVEIIICLTVIVLISSISILFLTKNRNENNIEKITNNILTATKVFANVEKDENGNNFIKEIEKGRGGVKIPLSILVNKGYVKKEDANVIYNEYKDTKKLKNNEDYYVLLLDGRESEKDTFYCENNQYQLEASWKIDADKTLYLCNKKISNGSFSGLSDLLILNNKVFFGYPDRDDYKEEDKGLYILPDDDGNSLYFYGNIKNNYLKFSNEIWRIVRINGDGSIKIILNDKIPVTLSKARITENGNIEKVEPEERINIKDKKLTCLYASVNSISWHNYYCFYNFTLQNEDGTKKDTLEYDSYAKQSEIIYYSSNEEDSSIPVMVYSNCNVVNKCENQDAWPWYKYNGNTTIYGDNSNLLMLAKFWYVDKIDKNFVSSNSKMCVEYYKESDTFKCKKKAEKDQVGLISKKEYELSVGYTNNGEKTPNSYLIDNNMSFFLSDFYTNSSIYYFNSSDKKINSQFLNTYYYGGSPKNLQMSYNGVKLGQFKMNNGNGANITHFNSINMKEIRPVINLKKGLCFKGDGSDSNPYEIIDGECN